MNILRLAFINYKRQLKDKGNLVMMLILPVAIILGMHFTAGSDSNKSIDNSNIALCINDKGTYGQELTENIKSKIQVLYNAEKDAMKLLEDNEVVAVYIIGENFSESIKGGVNPKIQSYKLQKGNGTDAIQLSINEFVKEKMKENILLRNGVIENTKELERESIKVNIEEKPNMFGNDSKLLLFMLFYFEIMSSNVIAGEMLSLRKEKVLKRAVTTANKGYAIIGSIYLSLFFVQITYFGLSLFGLGSIFKAGAGELILGVVVIAILSLLSISLGLLATRVCENPGIVNIALILLNIVGVFISVLTQIPNELLNVPAYILNIAKFTPQYWAINIIEKGSLFPGLFVLVLMTIVLFTCGNIRANEYLIKE